MSRKPAAPTPACPCGGLPAGAAYADCCGRYIEHFDTQPAPDAERLMRSRYTAFVRENADYLLATWHPSTRPPALDFEPGLKWLGLQVRHHRVLGDAQAEVEFIARSRLQGRASRLHERSRFLRAPEASDISDASDAPLRWYYVDGDFLA